MWLRRWVKRCVQMRKYFMTGVKTSLRYVGNWGISRQVIRGEPLVPIQSAELAGRKKYAFRRLFPDQIGSLRPKRIRSSDFRLPTCCKMDNISITNRISKPAELADRKNYAFRRFFIDQIGRLRPKRIRSSDFRLPTYRKMDNISITNRISKPAELAGRKKYAFRSFFTDQIGRI